METVKVDEQDAGGVALRIGLATGGLLAGLLLTAAVVQPQMMMAMLHTAMHDMKTMM